MTADHVAIIGFTAEGAIGAAGISLFYADYCNISDNNCLNNYHGISIANSNENSIANNTCSNNGDNGIALKYSTTNSIYLNKFVDNFLGNANSLNSTNIWQSPSTITYTYNGNTRTKYLGNYRSDYKGSDSDGDGIGDSYLYSC